jgi:hypothetical protein
VRRVPTPHSAHAPLSHPRSTPRHARLQRVASCARWASRTCAGVLAMALARRHARRPPGPLPTRGPPLPLAAMARTHLPTLYKSRQAVAAPRDIHTDTLKADFFTSCTFYTSRRWPERLCSCRGERPRPPPAHSACRRHPKSTPICDGAHTRQARPQRLRAPAPGLACGLHAFWARAFADVRLRATWHAPCDGKGEQSVFRCRHGPRRGRGGSFTEDPPFGGLWCDQPAFFCLRLPQSLVTPRCCAVRGSCRGSRPS